jgi:fumarate reductase subunit D
VSHLDEILRWARTDAGQYWTAVIAAVVVSLIAVLIGR